MKSTAAPSTDSLVSLAVSLHQSGHPKEAEELYESALKQTPDNADALHFLGILRHQQGRSEEAIGLVRKSLVSNPHYVDARVNLGNIYKETERYDEARRAYQWVIDRNSKHAESLNNLAVVLRVLDDTEQAIELFERAIIQQPQNATFHQNLGNALKSVARVEDALTAYRRAVELDPKMTTAHLSLGRALYVFGRIEEAVVVYKQWLQVEPENAVAKHMLAACEGGQVPERCSDEFVKQSFDAFASSFDEVLDRLEYRAPSLIEEAVTETLPEPSRQFSILDAGCGTGLCGEALRSYASRLVGIDLSPKMLVKASARKCFDELQEAELSEFMVTHTNEFDVIISADTLVYFGALERAFDAASIALRGNGYLLFTVEHWEQPTEIGYQLNPHGRYSHGEQYVRNSLHRAGFEVLAMDQETLRREVRRPVTGLVVTAQLADR
ncbi:MAG: tetratricopeptide repeat protein [Planctomycetota bacterium]